MIAYTDLSAAIARATERACGYASTTDAALLSELLLLSSAKEEDGTTHYRVFLVAALFLEQCPAVQTLLQAEDGVKFSQLTTTIASLRKLQAGYDNAQSLIIPVGFEAIKPNRAIAPFTSHSRDLRAVI